jgi:YebC/PmpR family DNA-binding regulatory protein
MAGHSKWANIKHRKGAQDVKRGKIFTKLIKEITIAAQIGGGDADSNPRLRAAIDKARSNNMTNDTINRAVKRGAGDGESANLEEIVYEGYGPSGVAIMVETLTDNKNRTVGEVRHAFTKFGGNLGTSGSVAYLFTKTGIITFAPGTDEDKMMEAALEAGADDVQTESDGSVLVYTAPEEMINIREALEASGLKSSSSEITMNASTATELDLENAEKLLRLVDKLEDCDDVQNVYHNGNISDEVAAQL